MTRLFLVVLFLALGLLARGVVGNDLKKTADVDYGVVIDLGSKGSRVSVFVWPSDADEPYTQVEFGGGKNPWYSKITPGVSTFATNPVAAGPYLKPLLDYAASNVPSAKQKTTPIFMRGTDNLRQLPGTQAEAILSALQDYAAKNYKFLITANTVGLLTGNLEGGFMWVAANYLTKTFKDEKNLIGALDLGSGSTQIAFVPKSGTVLPSNYYYLFTYEKTNYTPYVHSFSGYGYTSTLYAINKTIVQSSIPSDVVYNPCLLAGYSSTIYLEDKTITMKGTGSWPLCSTLTYNFLNKSAPCSYAPCSFSGAFQPALRGDFLAVSNFVDVVSILGYSGSATIADIIEGGIKFCSLSWEQALKQFPDEDPADLATFCFGANYVSTLLEKGYGFGLSTSLQFAKNYNKAPYTWALGAMVFELQMGW